MENDDDALVVRFGDSLVIRSGDVVGDEIFNSLSRIRLLTLRGSHPRINDNVLITLTRLECLSLPHNSTITTDAIIQLPSLTILDLDNNRHVCIPSLRPIAPQLSLLRIDLHHLSDDMGKSSNTLKELVSSNWGHVDIEYHGASRWVKLGDVYKRHHKKILSL